MAPLLPTPGPWFTADDGQSYRKVREATPALDNPGATDIALFQRQGDGAAVYMLATDGKSYLPMPLGEITLPAE